MTDTSDEHTTVKDKILSSSSGDTEQFADEIERAADKFTPHRLNLDPEKVQKGLAQLVLTVIELLRQLMERQAVARIEAGTLTDEEIDRLGDAFMKLDARMDELKSAFGLEGEDLNLDLGPLGDLM